MSMRSSVIFSPLDSWVTIVAGYQGDAKLVFNDIPNSDKTGFQIFLSDGIASATNFFLLEFIINRRPVVSNPVITLDIYRNLNLSVDLTIDMNSYFTDPEGDVLFYSFWDVPPQLNVMHISGAIYQIIGEFDLSTVDLNFTFKANDGVSLPVNVTVQVLVQDCYSDCERCFGPNFDQWYSCVNGKVLDGNSCVDQWSIGRYQDGGEWKVCHEACDEWYGPTNQEWYVWSSDFNDKYGVWVEECGDYYFKSSNQCISCSLYWKAWTSSLAQDWVQWKEGYVFTNNECVLIDCPAGQYADTTACSNCHQSCQTCSNGNTNADCTQCNKGYGFNENNQWVSSIFHNLFRFHEKT